MGRQINEEEERVNLRISEGGRGGAWHVSPLSCNARQMRNGTGGTHRTGHKPSDRLQTVGSHACGHTPSFKAQTPIYTCGWPCPLLTTQTSSEASTCPEWRGLGVVLPDVPRPCVGRENHGHRKLGRRDVTEPGSLKEEEPMESVKGGLTSPVVLGVRVFHDPGGK